LRIPSGRAAKRLEKADKAANRTFRVVRASAFLYCVSNYSEINISIAETAQEAKNLSSMREASVEIGH
jgi:hypothetical protein